jgi:hypothetical protein
MMIVLSSSVRITAKLGDRSVPARRHHNEVTAEAIETLAIVRSAASRVHLTRLVIGEIPLSAAFSFLDKLLFFLEADMLGV